MPKIAQAAYPATTLTDAIGVVDKIAKDFSGRISTGGLAKALGMAEKGGGFLHKVAALRDYSLVEGRGTLRITPLAERIIFSHSDAEGAAARGEAFLGIDLFQKLFERTQGRVPDEESFAIFLQDITGAKRMDVAKASTRIRRIYADGVEFAKAAAWQTAGGTQDSEEGAETGAPAKRSTASAENIEVLAGDVELRLPRTAESIDIIIGVLNMIRKQLGEASDQREADES